MNLVPTRKASEILGLHPNTLRRYEKEGKINTHRPANGYRLWDIDSFQPFDRKSKQHQFIIYCRVSSSKQKDDLYRQKIYMQERFPDAECITDIGSGINFKRKGLNSILERLLQGDKLTIIVAHKDRLARFGFDLIKFLVEKNGGEIMVLDNQTHSPEQELTRDLLSILHVFSCRMHGLRKYSSQIKEDTYLTDQRPSSNL
jgi:hypothetical protein